MGFRTGFCFGVVSWGVRVGMGFAWGLFGVGKVGLLGLALFLSWFRMGLRVGLGWF